MHALACVRKETRILKIRNRAAALMLAALMLFAATGAMAEGQKILLPDGTHTLTIPEEMSSQEPSSDEKDLKGIYLLPPDLEILVYAYPAQGVTVQVLAEALVEAGRQAEVRDIGGTDFLVFQDRDESDGAYCVGYGYVAGEQLVEISFFYATQAAADLTAVIMESFQE